MTQIDMVQHYRNLRGIAADFQNAAFALVQHSTLLEFGRRLGVVRSGDLWGDHEELKLAYDLAIHTARPGRSRAIDRYGRTVALPPGCDEARVLAALRQARFTMFKIEARHAVAGVMACDMLTQQSFHFMDVAIGMSAEQNDAYFGRLVEVDVFRMSCLCVAPLTPELLAHALPRLPTMGKGPDIQAFQDPRFAVAMYRSAITLGYMRRTVTFDVVEKLPTAADIAVLKEVNDRLSADLPQLTDAD